MITKKKSRYRIFAVQMALLFAVALICGMCETKKEFDYWQYVDWESPNPPDDNVDQDAGADGGDMEDMDSGMGD